MNKSTKIVGSVLALWLATASQAVAQNQKKSMSNWVSDDKPCAQYDDLRKKTLGDIGVRLDVAEPWAEAFRKALGFWNTVLDANFHEDKNLKSCAIRVTENDDPLLKPTIIAHAQFTELDNFRGKIAVDAAKGKRLSSYELYTTAVHEIGHLLGLKHNPNIKSVMYYMDVGGDEFLDYPDKIYLLIKHTLRPNTDVMVLTLVGESPAQAMPASAEIGSAFDEAAQVSVKSHSRRFLLAFHHLLKTNKKFTPK